MSQNERLNPQEIPFMHYGIINKYNFTEKQFSMVPLKRWDPLGFNYGLNPKFPQYSYIYGHYSYISPVRSERPVERKDDVEKESDGKDVIDIFEPMVQGKVIVVNGQTLQPHSIIIADGEKAVDPPFANLPRVYSNLTGNAVTMVNRYPAMARVIDSELLPSITNYISQLDANCKIAYGACLLTIPRQYYTRIQDFSPEELRDLFLSMVAGINHTTYAAQQQYDIRAIPISPFFNVGKLVGGSLKRIHAQIYMDLSQDGHGAKMENLLTAFEKYKQNGYCHLCKSSHGITPVAKSKESRLILSNDDWEAYATGSPIRNYHLRFSPRQHIDRIEKVTSSQFLSLAKLLRVLFIALDDAGVNPNRNMIFNTKPFGYDCDFHIFGEILPHEFIGGAEMAEDMRVVRMSPWLVAEQLQTIIKSKYANLV